MIVSYQRVSTDMQDNGLEVQSNEIKRYCDYKDITLEKSYVDFGVSGGKFDRDSFSAMIENVKQNKISCIIIQELSRFGRNMFESLKYIEILKKHKCNLVVIKENIELDNSSGTLFFNILLALGQWEKEQISIRTSKTLQVMKERGDRYTKSAYGYDVSNGKMVINDKEQFMLRKIEKLKNNGKSYNEIKDYLNRNGYKKKNNTQFNRDNVVKLFRNHIN
jgi:site-specific DNA recombinase|tara:strand:- start:279 stop:938 length:660 start_codon:yes stop_codon:yes gene_type:complete